MSLCSACFETPSAYKKAGTEKEPMTHCSAPAQKKIAKPEACSDRVSEQAGAEAVGRSVGRARRLRAVIR